MKLTEGLFNKLFPEFMFCCNCCINKLLLLFVDAAVVAVDSKLLLFPAEPVANRLALLFVLWDPPLEAPAVAEFVNNGFVMFRG